ncbi:hypothetical protein ACSNOH_35330, partial [Streptomyces sp. URMC 127]
AGADAVRAHLERLEAAPAEAGEPAPAEDPEWPPPPEDEEYEDFEPFEDDLPADPDAWNALPAARPHSTPPQRRTTPTGEPGGAEQSRPPR